MAPPTASRSDALRGWRGIYPAALAAFAVLSLYQANVEEVGPGQLVRPLLLAVLLAAGGTLLLRRLLADATRGGLLSTGLIVLFFSYGHLYRWLQGVELAGVGLGQHRFALAIAALALVLWLLLVFRWLNQPQFFERAVAMMALIALAMPLLGLVWQLIQRGMASPAALGGEAPAVEIGPQAALPDIYYLVLDGYGRQDVLQVYYQHDNAAFLRQLELLGFFVADESYANYNQTVLSLASSLNMTYLDTFASQAGDDPAGRGQLTDAVKHSRLRETLEGLGYETVAFETGYAPTEWHDADLYLSPLAEGVTFNRTILEAAYLSPFESQLLATTAFRLAFDFDLLRRWMESAIGEASPYLRHRARVEFVFDRLPDLAQRPGPTLVFAHVISPHPPFVFGSNGETIVPAGAFSLADADAFGGSPQQYIDGYRQQLVHVNRMLLQALKDVLAQSERPPVIVLQGDHGPGAHMVWSSADESLLVERMGILNAYYFSGEPLQALPDDLSPVNSFRLVLATLGGEPPELLSNRSYFATWDDPLTFYDVTARLP